MAPQYPHGSAIPSWQYMAPQWYCYFGSCLNLIITVKLFCNNTIQAS